MRATIKLLTPLLLGACLLTGVDAQAEQIVSAAHELARLQHVGAEAYTQELYRDDARWGPVLSRIDTGQREWLQVAQAMKPAADGAVAEELQASISRALIRNPRDVLRLLSPDGGKSTWRFNQACIGSIPTPGKAWLARYKAKAIRAIAAVRDPDLREQKRQCLRGLHGIDLSGPKGVYE